MQAQRKLTVLMGLPGRDIEGRVWHYVRGRGLNIHIMKTILLLRTWLEKKIPPLSTKLLSVVSYQYAL